MRIVVCLACAFACAPPVLAFAEEAARTPVALVTGKPADPCGFERSEAYGAGLMSFSTEMLWGCEAVARRRAAGMPLGERLERFADAMARYEAAVNAAAHQSFARRQSSGWYTPTPSLSNEQKQALAEETGALGALDAIRSGF